jgi:CubicO group peptidase (beta-lactamase class C family)
MPSVKDEILELMRRYEGHMVAAVAQRGDDVLFEDILEVKDGMTLSRKEAQDKYLFHLGSASKIIAGFALYILLNRREDVALDDPVSDHGLHFKGAENVTIRSLLTHKSGLPKGNDLLLGPAGKPLQDRDAALSTIESFASTIPERKSETETKIETDKF